MRGDAGEQQHEQARTRVHADDVWAGQRVVERRLNERARFGQRGTGQHGAQHARDAHICQHVVRHVGRSAHDECRNVGRADGGRAQRQAGERHGDERGERQQEHGPKAAALVLRSRRVGCLVIAHRSAYSLYSAS